MSQVWTEVQLFNKCVECLSTLDPELSKLNLQFVNDTKEIKRDETDKDQEMSVESKKRRALRLYQMLWSALTKSLVKVVKDQVKGLEIPGFGVFGPVVEEWSTLRDPMEKGPVRSSPFSLKKADLLRPTVLLLY